MRAPVVGAIDQQAAHAGRPHFTEGDFLRTGGHAPLKRDGMASASRCGLRVAMPLPQGLQRIQSGDWRGEGQQKDRPKAVSL
jgi:hypothetical protein